MKIGDKVLVTFEDGTKKEGIIIGESTTLWKIDFLDGEPPVAINKTEDIIVIDSEPVPNPDPDPEPRPDKKPNWKLIIALILFGLGVIAAFIFIK